jgi:hypothetical protein
MTFSNGTQKPSRARAAARPQPVLIAFSGGYSASASPANALMNGGNILVSPEMEYKFYIWV